MKKDKGSRPHNSGRSLTIPEFCRLHGISRSMYYVLRAQGCGPREMRIGRIIRITVDANRDWQHRMEAAGAPGSASRPTTLEKERSEKEKRHRERSDSHARQKRHERSRRHEDPNRRKRSK